MIKQHKKSRQFLVTVSPIATEYLGCEINVAENYSCGWIGQSDLYKNLEKKFGNMLKPSPATLRESVAHLDWHRVIRTLVRSG